MFIKFFAHDANQIKKDINAPAIKMVLYNAFLLLPNTAKKHMINDTTMIIPIKTPIMIFIFLFLWLQQTIQITT